MGAVGDERDVEEERDGVLPSGLGIQSQTTEETRKWINSVFFRCRVMQSYNYVKIRELDLVI